MIYPDALNVSFILNGRKRVIAVAPSAVLADVLREDFGLKGTKISCDQGVCGACTVLIDGLPTASCTEFAFMLEGRSVTTIEGLGSTDRLHPIQKSFVEAAALQCGFCTPGMILLLEALMRQDPDPDETTLRQWLASSVCRCTGYQVVIDAALLAARRINDHGHPDAHV
jgi:aerobic carbon-monoxide dehydrogenase small subunit